MVTYLIYAFSLIVGVLFLWADRDISPAVRVTLTILLYGVLSASYSAQETHKHTHEIMESITGEQIFDEQGRRL